jgi:hypothetical protein
MNQLRRPEADGSGSRRLATFRALDRFFSEEGGERWYVARFRAYLHARHALLAVISAGNEGHAPKCVDWDLKATRKIEGWARGQW